MSVQYRIDGEKIIVFGQTFPVKERLKMLGARFNGQAKTWEIPNSTSAIEGVELICGGPAVVLPDSKPQAAAESPTPMRADITDLTVAELMAKLQLAVASAFPNPVWIVGELHNVAERKSGFFFSISESKGDAASVRTMEIKTILWDQQFQVLKRKRGDIMSCLADGMSVRMLVQVGLYADRGSISLTALDIDPAYTKGALALAREKLLRDLRQKGLDQKNKRLTLPKIPLKIGLITSPGSRAYSDFIDQLQTGRYPGDVLFAPVQMQGERTPREVVAAIDRLSQLSVDMIIVTRGGGSAADLRWFDHQDIAYGIAESSVPIIAAIGHHDDRSVAEEISFKLLKTPTAAADYICELVEQVRLRYEQIGESIKSNAHNQLMEFSDGVRDLNARIHAGVKVILFEERLSLRGREASLSRVALRSLGVWKEKVNRISNRLLGASQALVNSSRYEVLAKSENLRHVYVKHLQRARMKIDRLSVVFASKDPRPWMQSGWTQLWNDKDCVKSIRDLRVGDDLRARVLDGVLDLKITDIKTNQGGSGGDENIR